MTSPLPVGKSSSIFLHTIRFLVSMQLLIRIAALAVVAAPFFANAVPLASPLTKEVIPGKYIVQLKPEIDVASLAAHHNRVRGIYARNLARRGEHGANGSPVEREYGFGNFKAYSGSFDEATIEELKAMPEVSRCAITTIVMAQY
jgi:oryzin